MNWLQVNKLTQSFGKAAISSVGFATERQWFGIKNKFLDVTGLKANWAIDRDVITALFREALPQRYITPMNAAAMLCALSIRHKDSGYDPVNFLNNFLKLYNAKTVKEVLSIENISPISPEFTELWAHYNTTPGPKSKKLEALKIRCWAMDLERATSSKDRWALPSANHKSITVKEVEDLIKLYPSKPIVNDVEVEGPEEVAKLMEGGVETNSAFPKDTYLPMLRKLRASNRLNETQCGIILCFILHSREKRNDKKTSYITHPMAVGDLVRQLGDRYFPNDKRNIWESTLVALLHDGGEKSNIDLENDLEGLLPKDVIAGIKAVHKDDDTPYFEYSKECADDLRACLAKLADSIHNMSDAGNNPSFKQAYVYPININYCHYRLTHLDEDLSVVEYMQKFNICSDTLAAEDLYDAIAKIADNRADKKMPAAAYRDKLGAIKNLKTVHDIQTEEIIIVENKSNANTRREEDFTLQP